MNGKHTPGPWRQGKTLITEQTSRWTPAEIKANDEFEKRMVFADFAERDEGQGRRLVATCRRQSDAQLVAATPDLLALLIEACHAITGAVAYQEGPQFTHAREVQRKIESTIEKLPKAEE